MPHPGRGKPARPLRLDWLDDRLPVLHDLTGLPLFDWADQEEVEAPDEAGGWHCASRN